MSSICTSTSYETNSSIVLFKQYDQTFKCVSLLMENFFNGQSSTLVSQQNLDIFNNLINHYFNKNPTYYPLEGYTSSNVENNTSFNSFCKTKTKITISLDLLHGDYVCLSKHFISNKLPVNIILISNI
eukprot:141768_1